MNLRPWRDKPAAAAHERTDRAVIARQRELIDEQAETIRTLGMELEATRALIDPDRDHQVAWLRKQCATYRGRWVYWQRQAELAVVIIRRERERQA